MFYVTGKILFSVLDEEIAVLIRTEPNIRWEIFLIGY